MKINRSQVRRYSAYFIIITVTVIVLSIYAGGVINDIYYEKTVSSLTETARFVKNSLFYSEPEDIELFCKSLGTLQTRITIIKKDGTVSGDSKADISDLENHSSREEIQEAFYGRTGTSVRLSESINQELLYIAIPSFNYKDQEYVLRVSTAIERIDNRINLINLNLIISGIIILALISLLSLFFERKMIKPIAKIQEAALAYASGKLDYYIKIDKPEDLKEVASAMNEMAGKLKTIISDVTMQRNELRTILSSMIEAVVVLDKDLKIIEINPAACRLAGYSAEYSKNKSLLEVIHNTELFDFAKNALKTNIPQEKTVRLLTGTRIILQVHATTINTQQEHTSEAQLVLVLNNITKIKILENMRKDFVANVSHELKTPITSVIGYIETLLDGDYKDKENAENFLDKALKNSKRLNAIIDDLLILSRLEQDSEDTLSFEPCSLSDIINSSIQICKPKADKKNIKINFKKEKIKTDVNPLLIEQALTNLIDNAVKYSNENDTIEVSLKKENSKAVIRIKDNGTGISETDAARIFERFYRVDKARSRALGGTGLGLAIVKHIVLAHGGTINVESELGTGSTFIIILPLNRQ
jgi:two-component system, OmpR family, phosphate regulon sensor histidine kinase PhoR